MAASGNTVKFNLNQCPDHHDNSAFYGNLYHHHQPPVSNLEMGSVDPSNLYNSYMVSSPSSRLFHFSVSNGPVDQIPFSSNHTVTGVNMDEYGRNHHSMDNVRGSCKRKNGDEVLENNSHGSMPNSSSFSLHLPQNSGLHNRDKSFETGVYMMDATNFTPPEYIGVPLPPTDGSQRNVRSRPNVSSLQVESPVYHHHCHHNNSFQGDYTIPSFQPAGSACIEQFGFFGSIVGDGGSSTRDHAPAIPYMQGSSFSGGPVEIGNMDGQGYLETSLSRNSAFLFHPPYFHNQHQHFPSVQGMHSRSYSHHPQLLAPSYGHPVNNFLHHGTVNHLRDNLMSRIPRTFPSSTAEWSDRPHQWSYQAVPEGSDGRMRILSQEGVAIHEFPGFYGVDNSFDQHRDMRLDIDSLSYEELLALEEQIGDVNTGLSEDFILKNLKTRIYSSAPPTSIQSSNVGLEDQTCIICQMEYEEDDRLGTLGCGHDYHADCINQWLLVKNLCPICKTSSLALC